MGQFLEYAGIPKHGTARKVLKWLGALSVLLVLGVLFFAFVYPWYLCMEAGMAGRREADAHWAAGDSTIYAEGGNRGILAGEIDQVTGLPLQPVMACVESDEDIARLRWHNARIAELIAKHGLPANSWLLREPGLSALQQTWKDRVAHGAIPVAIGSTEVRVSCGIAGRVYRLSAPTDVLEVDGKPLPWIGGDDKLEALGGSRDDKVLYLRHSSARSDREIFEAIDVSGTRLRVEDTRP